MFVIRVELRQPGSPDYTVHACARYSVTVTEGGRLVRMELSQGEGAEPHLVELRDGARAFIMNDKGDTVDSIRTESRARGVPA